MQKLNAISFRAGLVLVVSCALGRAQIPAFPGALGFGAQATGGRGGTVYRVTTLADSGPGSFRDAVSHPNRIVVFDVGGYISLASAVSVKSSITIAGQTAPGGGIGFEGGEISFANSTNIICRCIRIRPGSDTASTSDDCLSLYRARNVICDHVSLEFGPWNNIDAVSDDWQVYPVTSVTFQNCLNADPIYQQFGAHTESVSSSMSWFYNLFANSHNRNPLAKINTVFVNNVDYNCSAGYTTHTSTRFSHDIVNNYFIAGPAYSSSSDFPWYQIDNNQSIYYSGNLFDGNSDGALNGGVTTPYWYQGGGTVLSAPWSPVTTQVPIFSAATAYRVVVSQAGALPRDSMDNLVISQLKTLGNAPAGTGPGTAGPDGSLYTSQTQTGLGNNGYGVIAGGIPPIDSDGDGMPDDWEEAMGLNPAVNDAMNLAPDGYANIEHYLNWLAAPHALTTTNTPVDVDLWQFTSGFTNALPVYSLNNASNGIVSLNADGHTARFTPNANFFGTASFQFSVTASDGSAWTNTVSVLVSPMTPPHNLLWRGDGVSNVWNVGATTNWLDDGAPAAFNSGDNVTFDDTGSSTPAIELPASVAAGTVSVAASQDYTFTGNGALTAASLLKTGPGRLTLDTTNAFNGGALFNEGTVQLGDGASANGVLNGAITNNGALVFNEPGNVASATSISGSGTVTKTGAGALTLTGAQTYTNWTTLSAGSLQFSGAIPPSNVTNNGTLIFAPAASQVFTNAIRGSGSLTVNGAGVTTLSGANAYAGNTTNNSGFLVLANNAAAGSGAVVYNGGYVVPAAGTVITNDFLIPGSAATDLCMMATNTGTAVWAGNVYLGGSGQWRPGSDGGTLVFTGQAIQGNHYFIVPRGSVQFASNAVVSTTQPGAALGRDLSGNNRSANITFRDNASATLASCSLGGGKAGGSVTVTVQDHAALSFGANTLDLQNVARSTAVTTLRLNGGTLTAGGFTKTRTSYANVIDFNGGVLRAAADNAAFLPAFTAQTANVQTGGAVIDDGGFAITINQPLTHDSTLGGTPDGGLTKLGAGTLTLTGANTYTGPTLVNAGTVALTGSIANSSLLSIAAGAAFDAAGFTLGGGQTIRGNGLVAENFTLGAGATLEPGHDGIGALSFGASLTLAAGSTNVFEISAAPLTNDSVMVSGALDCGGTLVVTNASGEAPAAGEVFKLFSAGTFSGAFANVILPALAGGLAWDTNALNTNGVVSVVSLMPPFIQSASVSGNDFILSGTGGVAKAAFYLLSSTNLSAPISQWSRLLTNQFDNAGDFSLTNGLNANAPHRFYLLQLR